MNDTSNVNSTNKSELRTMSSPKEGIPERKCDSFTENASDTMPDIKGPKQTLLTQSKLKAVHKRKSSSLKSDAHVTETTQLPKNRTEKESDNITDDDEEVEEEDDDDKTKTADLSLEQYFANASLNPDSTDEEGIRNVQPAYRHSPLPVQKENTQRQKTLSKEPKRKGINELKKNCKNEDSQYGEIDVTTSSTGQKPKKCSKLHQSAMKEHKSKSSSTKATTLSVKRNKVTTGKIQKKKVVPGEMSSYSGKCSISSSPDSTHSECESSDSEVHEIRRKKHKYKVKQQIDDIQHSSSSEDEDTVDVRKGNKKRQKKAQGSTKEN